ncbi:non-canonical purine NTP phosphatase [Parashewanella curva]|uniref:Inosine/xanthosine triphosphatase n=1 Tax=Parashewanella curva TaxID=2338552 RepID=A0A3L8PWS2_9GAMM|nr:inosine/xanthosine triphosphatase [Parashewanella curva]RLV59063.1 non-canonical purine NTP phosphatase [Parashewanella curva]
MTQIKIIVGSKNPVKIKASLQAIKAYFPNTNVEPQGVDAPSLVTDQPMTAAETRQGAINRVEYCKKHHKADFYIAIEGGVEQNQDGVFTFAYIVIDDLKQQRINRSAALPLPEIVYQKLTQGEELGNVMDDLFGTENIKQKGGAIGLLTQGLATRQSTYEQAITLAMAPFIHQDLF